MTTGRINQVTTFPTCCEEQQMINQILGMASQGPPFFSRSSSLIQWISTLWRNPFAHVGTEVFSWVKTALFPDLTFVQTHCFLFVTTKIMAFWENYLRLAKNNFTKPRWIPKCINCNKLSQQQVVHIPHSLQAATVCARLCFQPTHEKKLKKPIRLKKKVHSKSAYPVAYRDASLIRQRTSQPTPLNHKGILDLFQPLCKLSIYMYNPLCLFILSNIEV